MSRRFVIDTPRNTLLMHMLEHHVHESRPVAFHVLPFDVVWQLLALQCAVNPACNQMIPSSHLVQTELNIRNFPSSECAAAHRCSRRETKRTCKPAAGPLAMCRSFGPQCCDQSQKPCMETVVCMIRNQHANNVHVAGRQTAHSNCLLYQRTRTQAIVWGVLVLSALQLRNSSLSDYEDCAKR